MERQPLNRNAMISSIGCIILMNAVLAVVAFAKDVSLANYFGTSAVSDAFFIAFFLTDTLGNNLIGQAVATGSIPVLSRFMTSGHEKTFFKVVYGMVAATTLMMLMLCGLMFWLEQPILQLFSGTVLNAQSQFLTLQFMLLLPTTLLYVVNALLVAVMQVRQKFMFVSTLPILFNVSFLIGVLICRYEGIATREGAVLLALWLTLTLLLLTAALWWAVQIQRKEALRVEHSLPNRGPVPTPISEVHTRDVVNDILSLTLPYLLVLVLVQGNLFVERTLAVHMGVGTVSALNYAYRLAQLPIWILISAINFVLFPIVAKLIHQGKRDKAVTHILKTMQTSAIIVIPIMLLLFELREPLITVLFKRHAFGDQSVMMTIGIFESYAFNILFQSMTLIGIRFLLAARETKWLMGALVLALSVNVFIDLTWVGVLELHVFGIGAIAGNVLASLSILAILIKGQKNVKKRHNGKFMGFILFTVFWASGLHILSSTWKSAFMSHGILLNLLMLTVFMLVASGLYYGISYKLKYLQGGDGS